MSLKDYGRLLLDGEVKVKYERTNAQRYTSDEFIEQSHCLLLCSKFRTTVPVLCVACISGIVKLSLDLDYCKSVCNTLRNYSQLRNNAVKNSCCVLQIPHYFFSAFYC